MQDFSPLEEDVFLKGLLIVHVIGKRNRRPIPGKRVVARACGYY